MKRKGFTLVELLVVIAIIALLMGILMPALARVRQLAFRMTCGTNLSGIGKAMLIYANDYEDELPKAGGRTNEWVEKIDDWEATSRRLAFGMGNSNLEGEVTVSSNFYLLVKYAEVTPKQFICKGETDVREFKLSELDQSEIQTSGLQLIDAWDFGYYDEDNSTPDMYCSYSYHWPFDAYALTTSSDPSMAIAADRNPWLTIERQDDDEITFEEGNDETDFIPSDDQYDDGTTETAKRGNSDAHQLDGQNVLFVDSHVQFEKRSYCGLEDDNIYTLADPSTEDIKQTKGLDPMDSYLDADEGPESREDSFLVQNDHELSGGGRDSGGGGR
jgi:prepilin-type N-terminal cleavage/methylation domain-containing protein